MARANDVKYQVQLLARAERDVENALEWYCDRSVSAANRWFDQLMARIDTLETRPERCSLAAEADEVEVELRELLFGKRPAVYRILFVITGQTVSIVHIRHGARDKVTPKDLH